MAKLFNPANAGQELSWLLKLIDLMIELPQMQALAESSDPEVVRSKIDLGRHEPAWGTGGLSRSQLEQRLLWVLLSAETEEGLTAGNPSHYTPPAYGTGSANLTIRRQVRESEDPDDVFLFFWDVTSELGLELKNRTLDGNGTTLRGGDFVRTVSPQFCEVEKVAQQGEHLGTEYAIAWGDAA